MIHLRNADLFLKDQDLQNSIKNNIYDTLPLKYPSRSKHNCCIEVNKMYRKVNKSISELGHFGQYNKTWEFVVEISVIPSGFQK